MEFLDSLIEFLGERSGLFEKYNWQRVFVFFMAISALLAAREYAKKVRKLKDGQRNALGYKALNAIIISTEDEFDVRYSANISSSGTGFRVTIVRGDEPNVESVLNREFLSLDEIEKFLRENTKFLLSDFE
ncbi:MAG: hypothetical protein K0U72_03030 [Gammaproteobacteria bacterium]|nr:hypothetical protein [Gammaproteobacteria bacterium]